MATPTSSVVDTDHHAAPRLHFSHNPVRRAALTVACGRCMCMTFCVSIEADTRFFWLDFHRLISWGAAPGCPCVLDKYAITPTALSSADSCGRPLRRWWKGNCTLHCASCGSHALKRGWYWHRSFPQRLQAWVCDSISFRRYEPIDIIKEMTSNRCNISLH
jgi:hypothetical protein